MYGIENPVSAVQIMRDMKSQIREQAIKSGYAVLDQRTATVARRFIGTWEEVDQMYPGIYVPHLRKLGTALDSLVEELESASGLTNEEKVANYNFFERLASSRGLWFRAEEYTGKIARLNGVQHPGHQELSGLDIRI